MKIFHLSSLLLFLFNFFSFFLTAFYHRLLSFSPNGSPFIVYIISSFPLGLCSPASIGEGTPAPPCWAPVCKVTPIEGQELPREGLPTSEPLHAMKVSCHPSEGVRISTLPQLCINQMPPYTKVLEIFNTSIHRLESSSFINLTHLKKIDLRDNRIRFVEPFAFRGLASLKRLDLSNNNISSLNGTQLATLNDLARLKLNHNPLKSLHQSLQDALPSLKALEIGDTLLHCDCHLSWLLKETHSPNIPPLSPPQGPLEGDVGVGVGSQGRPSLRVGRASGNRRKRRPLRLVGAATCQGPKRLRGTKLRKLSSAQLTCEKAGTTSVSQLELEPGVDQVVFAGDSLKLQCRVTGFDTPPARVWWRWGPGGPNKPPDGLSVDGEARYDDVTIKMSPQRDRMESYLHIPELSWDHSGQWSCVAEDGERNNSRSLSIYVIHRGTKYCPINVTSNNKGTYSWPRTVSSVSVELPCQGLSPLLPSHSSWPSLHFTPRRDARQARHYCGPEGAWHSLDTSECPYVSEATRILEHFATTNLSSASSTLSESARTLRNFTANGHVFTDPIDIVFLAQTVHQYVQLISQAIHVHPAAEVLVDVIASSMTSSRELLRSAEVLQTSCQNLIASLWKIADDVPTLTRAATPHLHMYQMGLRLQSFAGVSCVSFRKNRHSVEKHFRCNTNNYSLPYEIDEEVTDARIRIPSSPFTNITLSENPAASSAHEENATFDLDEDPMRLQLFVYDSSKLFPTKTSDSWQITSPVIGARLNDDVEMVPSRGVYVTLRSTIYSENIAPAVWEPGVNGSQGTWVKDKCQVMRIHNSMVAFKCHKLAHFGLLQDMAAFGGSYSQKGAEFKLSPPGVYVGSIICCLFLMASIATWGIHHNSICTMSKNKHSFINTWVALLFLVTLFTVGIYQTEAPRVCQIVGVLLHYLTTCVLFWIIVSVTNLYKKVNKALRPPLPSDEPPPDVPLPPKPMLRFYLVGWGIALIVCGISAAVNLRHYGTFSYCFLAWNPSVAAFYAPSIALVLVLVAFFLLTQCVLNTNHAGYSEATGNTETTELELLDAASPASENPPSGRAEDELSIASRTSTLSLTDAQHSPLTQLRAHAVTLILFVLTWASAAITAAAPFASVIPFHSTIFSIMYSICASSLGIFIFVFFCASRSDVVEAWKEFPSFGFSPTSEDETHLTVANNMVNPRTSSVGAPTTQSAPTNNQMLPTSTSPCVASSIHSVDSTNTHQTNKSSSLSQSVHASNKMESLSKASNALHMLNLSSLSESINYVPEMFYNPRQAGVAKRFFQKQRLKQMMKQNNLDMNRTDSDCNSSTVYKPRKMTHNIHSESDVSGFNASYLEVSNKINNTNIHVDSLYTKQTAKALTPELLCVLGPPKDTCSIVSSVENDQHQWPMTFKHQCIQTPGFYHPKNLNVHQSPLNAADSSETKEEIPRRISPDLFQEISITPTLTLSEDQSPDAKQRKPSGRPHRGQRPLRTKRKRSRSRGSGKDDLDWSEKEEEEKGTSNPNEGLNHAAPILDSTPVQDIQSPLFTHPLSSSPLSFSPVSSPPSPLVSALPIASFNSPSSLSPATSPLGHFSPSHCAELEWMHLLTKRRRASNESFHPYPGEGFLPDSLAERFCPSCSDGESTEGATKHTATWQQSLATSFAGVVTLPGEDVISLNRESISGCSSPATSMAPGADPSPPPSLPVSDSPFDSPQRKFNRNTPDSLSLESGSLLSPLRSHFSSMDNPPLSDLGSPDAEPITPTMTTPVNPPVSPITSIGGLRKDNYDIVGSSKALSHQTKPRTTEMDSPRSFRAQLRLNSSLATFWAEEVTDNPFSEPTSPATQRPTNVYSLPGCVIRGHTKKSDRKSSSSESLPSALKASRSRNDGKIFAPDGWIEHEKSCKSNLANDGRERGSSSSRETDV